MLVAGIDEAGRGPLAGPVVAAVVLFELAEPTKMMDLANAVPKTASASWIAALKDSKQLTARQRQQLYPQIIQTVRSWAVGLVSPMDIDRLNILQATLLAMRRAVQQLNLLPDLVLVDGNCDPQLSQLTAVAQRQPAMQVRCVVDGDACYKVISAASIIAKVTRDQIMTRLDRYYPGFGLAQHKGYGTATHRSALARLGVTPIHRRSFAPVRQILDPSCTCAKSNAPSA